MPCSFLAPLSSRLPTLSRTAYQPLLPPKFPDTSPQQSEENGPNKPGTAVGALRVVVQAVNITKPGDSAGFSRWRRAPRLVVRMYVREEGHDRETETEKGKGRVYETTAPAQSLTASPNWLSSSTDTTILLHSLHDTLELEVLALHSLRPRVCGANSVGVAAFSLGILEYEPRIVGAERVVCRSRGDGDGGMRDVRGTVLFDVFYYPVLGPGGGKGLDSKIEDVGGDVEKRGVGSVVPSSQSGIVTLRIVQVKDLEWNNDSDERPAPISNSLKLIATTHLGWSEPPIHRTAPALGQLHTDASTAVNVEWNAAFDFLCYDRSSRSIVIKIAEAPKCCRRNSRWGSGVVYGHLTVPLDDLLSASSGLGGGEEGAERGCWWPLSGCPRGALNVVAEWKSLEMPRKRVHRRASS